MNRAPRFLSLFLLFLLSPVPFLRAQTDSFRAAIEQLRAINTRERGYPTGDVPPTAQRLLPVFKEGLRKRIMSTLNAHAASSPDVLRTFLLADLAAEGVEPFSAQEFENNYNPDANNFGYLYEIEVRQPTRHPNLLAVVTNISVPCGSDSSLNVFQREGAVWKLILVSEANGYTEVSGAQGRFQFAVSPASDNGGWFVVTANVNPWCSSNWQQLRYQVLRPGDSPKHAEVLLDESHVIFLGVDQPYRLTIHPKGFQLHLVGYQSLDSDLMTRPHIRKYEVEGTKVTRVPPFALLPEDFLDEWMDMKWEEAARWISGSEAARLEQWHARIGESGDDGFHTEFDFVQPCPPAPSTQRWQIGLLLEGTGEKSLPNDLPDELFFSVIKRDGAFYLEGVATDRAPGCPGNSRAGGYSLNAPLP